VKIKALIVGKILVLTIFLWRVNMKEKDSMKYEIAAELGLADKIEATGWKSLTARESGRIGGILAKRRKDMRGKG